ncbi:hypothetical protein [Haloarcula argentinensis]|uniref:Uncharacterized protein n=1 Tax=Haloarcula argentinensis TaxID=43776 RepID=A0ABU2EZJ7_HALAR|nr:hypothetical protein [Haloarcula argentinensis]EMA24643.1 hypothetical protein C443_05774 [Haloarcula argentinensis DSM 12282]MDS0253241.1 hypothetical protein [Haloarcula argentinensis]
MVLRELLEPLLRALGVQGVSVVALAVLLSVALYAHKISTVGGLAVSAGSTVRHDLQVVALVLAVMLLLGVASLDLARIQELIYLAQQRVEWADLLDSILQKVIK